VGRRAEVKRETKETKMKVVLEIDGEGRANIKHPVPFFEHMLNLFAKHGLFDITFEGKGDVEVDLHHTLEDTGLVLGEAFAKALGDKVGIVRYGRAFVPMDEALAWVVVDIGGRPYFYVHREIDLGEAGGVSLGLVKEFFRAFVNKAEINLHMGIESGRDMHHIIEAIFKAFGRALDEATRRDERVKGVPSTKGSI